MHNLIEKAISENHIKSYEYDHFNDFQEIGFGRFGTVYRATCKNSHKDFALKSFYNINNISFKEIVHEFKLQRDVDFHDNIIRFYGITASDQDDQLRKYSLVMEYADGSTLRNYLENNFEKLSWDDKYNLAFQLAYAVSCLHDEGIVHRDLHSNNILIHQKSIKLADFGLSKRIEEVSSLRQTEIYDVIPYMDPKSLNVQTYKLNEKSDVYSVGVLLWEISSGHRPFRIKDEQNDLRSLSEKISQGLRETISPNTPEVYVNVYTECWNHEPDSRPIMKQVVKALITKTSITTGNNHESNLVDSSSSSARTIQNFDQMKTRKMIEILSNERIIPPEHHLSIIVEDIFKLIFNERDKTGGEKRFIQIILDYFNNQKFTLQDIVNWIKVNQGSSNNIFLLGFLNHHGIGMSCDKEKAFDLFVKASKQNHTLAHFYVGNYYFTGNIVTKDDEKAFEYYKKAADKDFSSGQLSVGNFYEHGVGVEKDLQLAIHWYEKSINNGNFTALFALGACYRDGNGVDVDEIKAFELFQKSTEGYTTEGTFALGYCYEKGIGTSIDKKKAVELYERSANDGNIFAMFYLGKYYRDGLGDNTDNDKAFEYFQKTAEANHPEGILNLAQCYEEGIGTGVNIQKAFELYERAANYGNTSAMLYLGKYYRDGLGDNIDNDKAFEYFQKTAEANHPEGILYLAQCYEDGIGTSVNIQKAFEFYERAANLNNVTAQNKLAHYYENEDDLILAIYWYEQSAIQGFQESQVKLEELLKTKYRINIFFP